MQTMKKLVLLVGFVFLGLNPLRLFAQPDVAILDSAFTSNYFSLHYPDCSPAVNSFPGSPWLGAQEYKRYFLGWEWVLSHMSPSIPYQVITDEQVTFSFLKEQEFKLLILSNTVSLSDSQQKAVVDWVRQGGYLIATFGAGYKNIISDPKQDDGLKLQKGGTGALHQLWGDPLMKLFTTDSLDPGGVQVRITRASGPTPGLTVGRVLGYGASGNLLIQRPENFKDVYGLLAIQNPDWTKPQPAILYKTFVRGRVVYYAFAPEFIVALDKDLPGHCWDDPNFIGGLWKGRSADVVPLMEATVKFMLGIP